MSTHVLKTVVFMGSAKTLSAPWAPNHQPARIGDWVLKYVKDMLKDRVAMCGADTVKHEVTVYDPLEVFGENGALAESGAEMKHPHFFYAPGKAPEKMNAMAATIKAADCYLIISCEYNHSAPPGLVSLLAHFGGSNYQYKPSAILTYSVTNMGGVRAQLPLQGILHELGCLPVSKCCTLPSVTSLFDEQGKVIDPNEANLKHLPAMLDQLEWFAIACANQRKIAPK